MKKKVMLILSCLFLSIGFITAQTTKASGIVVDDEGQAVERATVIVKGTTVGVMTDEAGKFSITMPAGKTVLVFSLLGMKSVEQNAGADMHIVLEPDETIIDDVVITGYGTTKKASFAGAASVVTAKKLAAQQSSNISKSLEGAISGVQVSSASGQPGSAASIRIRGVGSISAKSTALIIVDGIPYEGSLNTINTQDVESMTVLKDAAANSLYGARGANGVVVVTTKRGVTGKVRVTLENRTGVNSLGVSKYKTLTSPQEYYELYWESIRNQQVYGGQGSSAINAGIFASNNLIQTLGYNNYNIADKQLIDPATGRLNANAQLLYHDDWLDEAFKTGLRQENNMSVSGGTEKSKYYASLNYLDDNSYTKKSGMTRLTSRLNMDTEINSWFKTSFGLTYTNVDLNTLTSGETRNSSIFFFGQSIAPIYPVYQYDATGKRKVDANGNDLYDYGVKRPFSANSNAIAQQVNDIQTTTVDAITAQAQGTIKFLQDFDFTVRGSISNYNASTIVFQNPLGGDAVNVNGRSTKQTTRVYTTNLSQMLNWKKTIAYDHHLSALALHEIKKDNSSNLWAQRENFLLPDSPELAGGAKLSDASSSADGFFLEGFLGQFSYDYMEKYYLTSSLRRDGSSRFHPDHRWGNFAAVGLAWRMKKEEFLVEKEWVNDLKLRASYGTQGNDGIPVVQGYMDEYQVENQDGVPALNLIFRGNKLLTWEKSASFNVGFDFRIFDKLGGTIEYYSKNTTDLLYSKPLAPSEGNPSSILENPMAMTNKGVEVELTYDIINTNDLKWNFSLNATHNANKITKLPADRPQDGWETGNYMRKIGKSLYNYYDYKYAGVNPDNGDPLYYADVKDAEGNTKTITVNRTADATRYELGKTSIPDLYGGFSTNITYKGFDLEVSTAYELGGWSVDSNYMSSMSGGNPGQNWNTDIYNRWTPNNRNTDIPRLEEGNIDIATSSDRFYTSRTSLSIRNANLGYTFAKSMLSKYGIEKLRLYVVGDNILFFSKRQGFDPRQSYTGATGQAYSPMRTISFGINLNF